MSSTRFPQLRGVIPPVLTPLNADGTFDAHGFRTLLDHLVAGQVHGLFVLGTTGEGPQLPGDIQREVIAETKRHTSDKLPILVGITQTSISESIALASYSAKCGADVVVTAGPCYSPVSQSELKAYAIALADDSPLPVVLYNMPSHTKVWFQPATVAALMDHENIVGIKDTSGDMIYHNKLLMLAADNDDFAILVGAEQLMGEAVLMGADGAVVGGANLLPELYVALFESAVADDVATTRELQRKVVALTGELYTVGESPSAYIAGLKGALFQLGICQKETCLPLLPLDDRKLQEVATILDRFGIVKEKVV